MNFKAAQSCSVATTGCLSLVIVLCFARAPFDAFAQDQTTGVMRVLVEDSRTGATVNPDLVLINGNDVTDQIAGEGLIAIPAENRDHQVEIRADGYLPATATVRVEGENTMVNTIALDPEQDAEPEEEIPPQTGILSGFVVDDANGAFVPGARIEIIESAGFVESDAQGAFALSIPVEGNFRDTLPVRRVTLLISKEGYVGERRRNVEVISGTRKSYSIRLSRRAPGEAEVKVIDEAREPARISGWFFDVSFRKR